LIYGERIRQARELRGLTQGELGGRIGVSQPAITQMESGITVPTEDHLQAIAFQTGLPQSFFRKEPSRAFPLGSLLYRLRNRPRTPARGELPMDVDSPMERARARRMAEILCEVTLELGAQLKTIPLRLPQLNESPEAAARLTRSFMGLAPDAPIGHLTSTIERAGVLVFALPFEIPNHDAFSVWLTDRNPTAVIATFAKRPGDRLRFSTAHELGHLVMHHAGAARIADLEAQANVFAAEFLLPECAMREELSSPLTLTGLAKLKQRWRVSIVALIERATSLEILTRRQQSDLRRQLALRGWDRDEPVKIPVERPRALNKMVELLYGPAPDHKKLASDLRLTVPIVRAALACGAGATASPSNDPIGKLLSFSPRVS
jgi:Zn-dependent peptidase ImmA (M78 family)